MLVEGYWLIIGGSGGNGVVAMVVLNGKMYLLVEEAEEVLAWP